jgi:hypothetical protein
MRAPADSRVCWKCRADARRIDSRRRGAGGGRHGLQTRFGLFLVNHTGRMPQVRLRKLRPV